MFSRSSCYPVAQKLDLDVLKEYGATTLNKPTLGQLLPPLGRFNTWFRNPQFSPSSFFSLIIFPFILSFPLLIPSLFMSPVFILCKPPKRFTHTNSHIQYCTQPATSLTFTLWPQSNPSNKPHGSAVNTEKNKQFKEKMSEDQRRGEIKILKIDDLWEGEIGEV